MTDEAKEMLENILGCFHLNDRGWYEHKDNDAEWIKVGEDLQDYLEEAREKLAGA